MMSYQFLWRHSYFLSFFCFTAYSFHRIFLKLGIYMYKFPAQTVPISDFENSSEKKKLWRQNISANGNRLKNISETRQAFWILFAGIEQGISRDEWPHIWYITMTSYQFLWRHSYFLPFFVSQPRVFIGSSWNLPCTCRKPTRRQ